MEEISIYLFFINCAIILQGDDFMNKQASESLRLALLLAFVGGFLDAYSYTCRGQVFATMQTGNMILLGIQILNGDMAKVVHYLLPISSFALGIFCCEMIKHNFKKIHLLHWRQIIILLEIIFLCVTFYLDDDHITLANCTISFLCAMQMNSFKKVNGYPYISTMCTGNLRSVVESLSGYLFSKNKKFLHKAFHYFSVIVLFISGVMVSRYITLKVGYHAVITSVFVLMIVFLYMFKKPELEE